MAQTDRLETPVPTLVVAQPRPGRWSGVLWMAVGSALLIGSGAARTIQDSRHKVESDYTESAPFPLSEIPKELGVWKMAPGGEKPLDQLTMRITGGTDHVLRTYVDELTGVSVIALVLFGPAEPVVPHTPDICYPSSGFEGVDVPLDRVIESKADGISAPFRSAIYAKSAGRGMIREAVYHSFRLEGQWSPYVGGRKFPRKNPSVFKVQVQRRVIPGEKVSQGDPIEQFLGQLVPAIERMLKEAAKSSGASTADVRPPFRPGDLRDVSPPSVACDGGADHDPAGSPMAGWTQRSRQPSDEHRGAPDQADQQDDRRQVGRQGQLHGERQVVLGRAAASRWVERAFWGRSILGMELHRWHSFDQIGLKGPRLGAA